MTNTQFKTNEAGLQILWFNGAQSKSKSFPCHLPPIAAIKAGSRDRMALSCLSSQAPFGPCSRLATLSFTDDDPASEVGEPGSFASKPPSLMGKVTLRGFKIEELDCGRHRQFCSHLNLHFTIPPFKELSTKI